MRELNHELDYRQQSKQITIRLADDELQLLKKNAMQYGVPYSTLIKALIFKFNRNMVEFL